MDEETNVETEGLSDEETLVPPEGWEEYDPDYVEPESEETPPSPEEAEEEQAPAASSAIAYTPQVDDTAEEAYIREALGDEGFAAIDRLVNARLAAAQQSMVAASAFVGEASVRAPELFRVHGAEIQRNIAQLPANIRGTQQGLATAVMGVALRQASETGDWIGALQSVAALVGKPAAQAQAQPQRPKPVVPPSQRPPTPSGARPQSGGAPSSARERIIASLIKDGLSPAEAEGMANDPLIIGRRR